MTYHITENDVFESLSKSIEQEEIEDIPTPLTGIYLTVTQTNSLVVAC